MSNSIKTGFFRHLHALRGIAIVTILGAHAWSFMIFWTGSLDDSLKPLFHFTESLFHGSTLYFAIISGLLFSKILHNKSWLSFFKSKFNHVFLPYLCITVFYTLLFWQGTAQYLIEQGQEANFILILLNNIATGSAGIHLWYIPVLAFLFVVTPVLQWLLQKQVWLLVGLATLPLIISRSPFPNFLEPQSFVYFLGAYALGMLMGYQLENVTLKARKHRYLLTAIAALLTGGIYALYYNGNQTYNGYSPLQTLVYLQKMAIFLVLLQWLEKVQETIPRLVLKLGDHAFGIFFIHLFTMGAFIEFVGPMAAQNREPLVIFGLGLASLIFSTATSMMLGGIVKLIFKQHARKMIGV